MSIRDQILQANDLPREVVVVPEWGSASVTVRTLTAAERDLFDASLSAGQSGRRDLDNVRARLLVLALVDDAGDRLFADGDADALGKKSSLVLARLFAVASRLNGIGQVGDELEKN